MLDICTFLVGVAQGASLSIQQILELNSRRKLTKANFKVKGDIFTTVVERNDRATDLVQALAGRLPGMRGVYAGRLRNARQVEALTINLVSVNRRYKVHAGIRVTDV